MTSGCIRALRIDPFTETCCDPDSLIKLMSKESGGTLNRSMTGINVAFESAKDSDNIFFNAKSNFSDSRNKFVELESCSESVISVSFLGVSV